MSFVLRYQEKVLEHGEKSAEAWLAGCELLADAVTDPRRTADDWDRNPAEAMEMLEKVVMKATEGLVDEQQLAELKQQAAAGNSQPPVQQT